MAAAVLLGSLALLAGAGEPQGCAAQRSAAAGAEPGFASLAGMGDPDCD